MLTILAYYLLYGMLSLVGMLAVFSSFPVETADFMLFVRIKLMKGEVEPSPSANEQAAEVLKFVLIWPLALFLMSLMVLLYYLEITGGPRE